MLKQQIGDYPVGYKAECIIADFDVGTISIDGEKFKLEVSVGAKC